jgi:hypothetical protein
VQRAGSFELGIASGSGLLRALAGGRPGGC